jgi:hypothetical protein
MQIVLGLWRKSVIPLLGLIQEDLVYGLTSAEIHSSRPKLFPSGIIDHGAQVSLALEAFDHWLEGRLVDSDFVRYNQLARLTDKASVDILEQLALPRRVGADDEH